MVDRWVIVNADDFGRSRGVNRGIVEAHERGIVTSASLMVRWAAAADAAAYARMRPELSVGLHVDLGRGTVVELPMAETERRWQATTPQWPIMHAVLHGVTRDQMMARHRANHIQVAYGTDAASADAALATKAAMFDAMGVAVHLCGDVALG